MKSLIGKGGAVVPKRREDIATNIVGGETQAMQTPDPDKSMSIGAASPKAAGLIDFDAVSNSKR